MKKVYVVGALLIASSLAGCTLKGPNIPVLPTGDVQTITETVLVSGSTETTGMDNFSGAIDSGVVPMVSGSADITTEQNSVIARFKQLIEKRNAEPEEEKNLTEDDIDVLDKTIQAVKKM